LVDKIPEYVLVKKAQIRSKRTRLPVLTKDGFDQVHLRSKFDPTGDTFRVQVEVSRAALDDLGPGKLQEILVQLITQEIQNVLAGI
jgi:hypothetical protein